MLRKFLLSTLVLIMTATASHARNHRDIYLALNVVEIDKSEVPFNGLIVLEKSAGDLTCVRSQALAPSSRPNYSCDLKSEGSVPKDSCGPRSCVEAECGPAKKCRAVFSWECDITYICQ